MMNLQSITKAQIILYENKLCMGEEFVMIDISCQCTIDPDRQGYKNMS